MTQSLQHITSSTHILPQRTMGAITEENLEDVIASYRRTSATVVLWLFLQQLSVLRATQIRE